MVYQSMKRTAIALLCLLWGAGLLLFACHDAGMSAHPAYAAPLDEGATVTDDLPNTVYLPFMIAAGTKQPTMIVPPTPDPLPTPTPDPRWDGIEDWGMQLSGYPDGRLDEIATSNFDLVVIQTGPDATRDFTRDEIAAVQAAGKLVLAYIEIGAIDESCPEWSTIPDDLRLDPVADWPVAHYVKYWDQRWWDLVIEPRLDQALAAGFDGVYLDKTVAYDEIPADSACTDREDLAARMVSLIAQIANYAKAKQPEFAVVPQNAPELRLYPGYLDAIDGLGQESLYYIPMDQPCSYLWCQTNREHASAIRDAGKLVLTIDFARYQDHIDAAYKASMAAGFVPYVTTAGDLDALYVPASR